VCHSCWSMLQHSWSGVTLFSVSSQRGGENQDGQNEAEQREHRERPIAQAHAARNARAIPISRSGRGMSHAVHIASPINRTERVRASHQKTRPTI
jgi:hypothetical protein